MSRYKWLTQVDANARDHVTYLIMYASDPMTGQDVIRRVAWPWFASKKERKSCPEPRAPLKQRVTAGPAATLQHWLGIGGVQVNRRPRDKSMSKVKRMGSGRWCLDDRPLFNSLDAGFGNEIQQETIKGTESNKWLSMLGQIEDQQHKLT